MNSRPAKPPRYIAELRGVREVSLLGSADLPYWSDRLRPEGLAPLPAQGRAEILIGAIAARFRGIAFRELIIAVTAVEAGSSRAGVYLAQAFNTSPFFAWIERNIFSTPYLHAQLDADLQPQPLIRLRHAQIQTLTAQMVAAPGEMPRQARGTAEECWEGPIYLPPRQPRQGGKHFFARLGGLTTRYAFEPGADVFELSAASGLTAIRDLVESDFTCREWAIRDAAHHARSKTYSR